MPIVRSDFGRLTDELQEVYQEVAKESLAESVGFKIFDVKDTNRYTYDYLVLHGLDGIQAVADGQDLPGVTSQQGNSATWTQSQYGALVSITKRMRKFDLHDQMEDVVRSITEDAFHKVDQSLADVLTNGFSSSNYTDVYNQSVAASGPDTLALFSASHSNPINSNVFRNLIRYPVGTNNPALSREAVVQTIIDGLNHLDAVAHNRPTKLDTLIVSPTNWDLATRILESDKISGSAENDTNMAVKGRVKNLIVWEKLTTRTGGTDTSAYWFMADGKKVGRSLKALFAERPTLDAPEVVYKNKNWDYTIDYFYAIGRALPTFIWGSTGS